jgi:HPt (histidine-containing phosphotransfer) domain-containing protein
LVEEDPIRAERLLDCLRGAGLDVLGVSGEQEAKEALCLRQFHAVLISSPNSPAAMAQVLRPATRQTNPPALLLAFEQAGRPIPSGLCDGLFAPDTPDGDLAGEISQAIAKAQTERSGISMHLPDFNLAAFREQMGEDPELMSEIVGLFFEESVTQLRELSQCLNSNEYNGASRIAHSLKGALGSIHAERARHWAAALESATAAGDHERSRQCLISLEKTLAILQPELRPLLLR